MLSDKTCKTVIFFIPAHMCKFNKEEVFGKPLLHWSIEAASASSYNHNIHVLCETDEEQEIAETYSSESENIFISRVLTKDLEKEIPIDSMRSQLEFMSSTHKLEYQYVSLLNPSCPFRRDNMVDECIRIFSQYQYPTLLTVEKQTPFFWKYADSIKKCTYDYKQKPLEKDLLEHHYYHHNNNNLMISESRHFTECGIVSRDPLLYVCKNRAENIEVNTREDLLMVQLLSEKLGGPF